jgi:hypothetical protein
MAYVLPQVLVFQEFNIAPTATAVPRSAHIAGPQAKLFRYSNSDEKEIINLGAYDSVSDTPYLWPERPAGSQVDFDFVKLYADPAAGCEAFRAEARKAIARGARVLIPAGGPLNMFFVDHGLREVDGVPILDILAVSIKAAEQAIALKQAGVPLKGASFVPPDRKAQLRQIFLAP